MTKKGADMPTSLRPLLHLMAKDWRYIRAWAVACWILTAAAWIVHAIDVRGFSYSWVHLVVLVVPGIAFARLLQADPVFGTTAFWSTRPISRTLQLASKLSVGAGTLVAPCLLIAFLPALHLGGELDDYLRAALSALLRYLLVVSLALIAPSVAPGRTVVALVLTAMVFGVLLFFPGILVVNTLLEPARESNSFRLVLPWLLLSTSTASVYTLYRWRRLPWAAAAWIAGLGATVGLGSQWRWDLIGAFSAPVPDVEDDPRWPLRLVPETGTRAWRGGRLQVRVEGVPRGVSLAQTRYQVEAILSNGQTQTWLGGPPRQEWEPTAMNAALGCARDTPVVHDLELVPPDGIRALHRRQTIRLLRGHVGFRAARWSTSARMSLRDGQLRWPGGRLRAFHTEGGGAAVAFEMLNVSPFRSLRGRLAGDIADRDPSFQDASSGDCFAFEQAQHYGRPGWGPLPIDVELSYYSGWRRVSGSRRRGIVAPRPLPSLPPDTELVFLKSESLSYVSVPFEYVPEGS